MPSTRFLYCALTVFVLLDLGYSARQYYHQPLDGDMAWNALPAPDLAPTLRDPLAVATWSRGKTYANPNRFFGQWAYRSYLLAVPALLRTVFDPVTSVYLASGLLKWLTHLGLLLLLVRAISGRWIFWRYRPVLILALLSPLFQAGGYRNQMGIIDPSTTYTFFYALPLLVVIAWLIPFVDWLAGRTDGKIYGPTLTGLWLLAPVICLSGPLNPGVVLVLTLLLVVERRALIPSRLRWALCWLCGLAGYSLFVGSYNSLTIDNPLPLTERYLRLPGGILRLLTEKIGPPVLLVGLLVNYPLLRGLPEGDNWRRAYRWVLGFAFLYTLLLPLGGYRTYRPLIVRYDTWLPVTVAAITLYAAGAARLLERSAYRRTYLAVPLVVFLIFTAADRFAPAAMRCEREILRTVARSQEIKPLRDPTCAVLDWQPESTDYTRSRNAELLRSWNILGRD